MLYIIIAILMFGFLIAIHEFGHFITAKLLGIRVNEFAIGMGPTLLSRQRGETKYALRAFPIGGFCAMEGEDDDSDDPRAFGNKAAWKKLVVLVAGSFMNFLAGFVILLLLVSQVTSVRFDTAGEFTDWSTLPAQGIQVGDRFLKVDGHRILTAGNTSFFLGRAGATADFEVERNGERFVLADVELNRTPVTLEDGTVVQRVGMTLGAEEVPATLGLRLQTTLNQSVDLVRLVWLSLGDLVTGAVGVKDLSGPIGIVDMISDVGTKSPTTSAAVQNILFFVAFIAINLAVMNLLPIPALDGGRIFFLAVNGVFTFFTRKKLDPKYEGYVNVAGFFCLILLMVVVAFNDVIKLLG